ncbi:MULTISPECIES: SRPBCC family protein [unclassified Streptomyces]|uniref:SRPBCC family protein n=1 Tax=unclassified Streptomyces TaxID=2593676 RepID=UPI00343E0350
MARRLRPVGADFVETAPLRLVFAREVSAPPEAVFSALAEDVPGWSEWFSAVTLARPSADGGGREVRLRGGTRFEETILVSQAPAVYTYRADTSNAPGLHALVEEWRLTPAGSGTCVRWTFAADGTAVFRAALTLGRSGLGRAFRGAVTALDQRLAPASA